MKKSRKTADSEGDPKSPLPPERKDPEPGVTPLRDPEPNPIPGRGPLQTIPSTNIPEGPSHP